MRLGTAATLAVVKAGALVNRTWVLPIVAISPTSRCHSRCVSCDWWRSDGSTDMTLDAYERLAVDLSALGTRLVLMTGGEPLLRDDVWDIASMFSSRRIGIHLVTSGLALRTHAREVARHCQQVIVSLDAASAGAYARVRGVDGFAAVEAGVSRLRAVDASVRVIARATLHRHNFREIAPLVAAAQRLGADQLSFLAADLSSPAFGPAAHVHSRGDLALTADEVEQFRRAIEECIEHEAQAFASGFIAESPDRVRRLGDYYAAQLGGGPFPPVQCDAPHVSVAIDADGAVRPCFFHAPIGNVRQQPLRAIVTNALPAFRASWRPTTDDTCQRCVCSLNVGWGVPPWA